MELERVLYIFGSFTRRRQDKRRSLEPSSLSAGNSPLHVPNRSSAYPRPTSFNDGNLVIAPRTSAYEAEAIKLAKEWECGLCKKQLSEPRVLGCLHYFCTRCLQGLYQEGELVVWNDADAAEGCDQRALEDSRSGSVAGSAGSGYESDLRNHSGSELSWNSEQREKPKKYGIYTRRVSGKSVQLLLCPSCGFETQLPVGGIAALPVHSTLQRKMVIVQDEETASVLCDLCTTDNKAESRCSQCLVTICSTCSDSHRRQKATRRHTIQPLEKVSVRYCSEHPRSELCVYCATCQQVVCRECCLLLHAGHALANATRAAAERCRVLRDACERAKFVPEHVDRLARTLHTHAHENDIQVARVEVEVTEWAEQYRRAVDTHGRALCAAAARARTRYHQRVASRDRELQERLQQAQTAVRFAEEVLAEAREDELLAVSSSVLRRLERVTELTGLMEPPTCELRFAPTAPAPPVGDLPLVGRLLTQAPDHDQCYLHTDGLQDLRVGQNHDVIFELRDHAGERIWCGGEQVAGFLRRKDSSARPDAAKVTDRGDGSYAIVLRPPKPGSYLLAVTLNNKPIKGSPFACGARVCRTHAGQFHCCAFCSSGGKRDAQCACGGTMSGGYKGCGHGHAGHPGLPHWSCCGSTERSGPCSQLNKHTTYQFSV